MQFPNALFGHRFNEVRDIPQRRRAGEIGVAESHVNEEPLPEEARVAEGVKRANREEHGQRRAAQAKTPLGASSEDQRQEQDSRVHASDSKTV